MASRPATPPVAPQPLMGGGAEPTRVSRRARIGRWLGPLAAIATYLLAPSGPDALSDGGRATAAVGVLMAVWWVCETLPLAVTSLLPIVLLPVTGALPLSDTTTAYGNPLVFLFLGGFVLAMAMQRWGLHRRIALLTVRAVGTRATRLVGGFMLATAVLSMWVSNTATTVMMLPIGVSVLALVGDRLGASSTSTPNGGSDDVAPRQTAGPPTATGSDDPAGTSAPASDGTDPVPAIPLASDGTDPVPAIPPADDPNVEAAGDRPRHGAEVIAASPAPNLAVGLMLGIAYAASIGSLATLIGTPPNTFLAGYLNQTYGIDLGFARWMMFALPMSLTFLVIAWLVLTRWLYPPEIDEVPGGAALLRDELAKLGPLTRGERNVLIVFVVMAVSWIARSTLQDAFAGTPLAAIDDASIAIAGAIALFALPVDGRAGVFTVDWQTAKQLPWGVLLLFGGGLALAAAVAGNGVDAYVGGLIADLTRVPWVAMVAVVAATILVLTELTSNTATTAALVPVVAGAAVALGLDPMALAIPAALAASCAFALPVATPPNAIVFGSGYVTIPQMVRAGVVLNVIGTLLIVAFASTYAGVVFGY